MTYLSKIAYGPEYLSVRDFADAMSQAFGAHHMSIAPEQVVSLVQTAVASRNRCLRKQPDGCLVVYYMDFFSVMDEVFEGTAHHVGLKVDDDEDWTKPVPEVGKLLSELNQEALAQLIRITEQGHYKHRG